MKILLIVLLIAAAVYGFTRLVEKGLARRRQAPKPIAPDDDLDFLRNLDWEQRKDRHRRRKDSDASDASGTDEPDAGEPDADGSSGDSPSS